MESHIDDPDVRTILDLEAYYPLPEGYSYFESSKGIFVRRKSDFALFAILLEAEMLTFDVPNETGKVTIEIEKKID